MILEVHYYNIIVHIIRFENPIIDARGGRNMDSQAVEEIIACMNQHAPNPQVQVVVLG